MENYKNYLDIHTHYVGNGRRFELMSEILKNGTFLPKTVTYKDIDEDFKRWADEELAITSDDGKIFPTMTLFSNQRFSEYSQTWKYTDKDKNLLLNFKTVNRDNNPEYGKIQNGYFNIPGKDRFYTMKKQIVLDDNGSESFLVLKMRQPVAIDLVYNLTIFTTKYDLVNQFNMMVNQAFSARQCYIRPNGHYMPMTLEGISDASSYNIEDRQYYGQTFRIKAMAYIITEDDYRVEEMPLKHGVTLLNAMEGINQPDVEIEECDDEKTVHLKVFFPEKCMKNIVYFENDTTFHVTEIKLDNIRNNYKLYLNGEIVEDKENITFQANYEVKLLINKMLKNNSATITFIGEK